MRGRYSFGERRQVDVWPGWVDALSSLLMVVIFLLMVFLVSQFYLSTMVSGRDETVGRLNRQISDLTDRLALEQESGRDLQDRIERLSTDLEGSARERSDLGTRLAAAAQGRETIDRQLRAALAQIETLTGGTGDRDAQLQEAARVIQDNQATIDRQRRELAQLQADMATLRTSGQDRDLTVTGLSTALAASRKEALDLGATLQQRQAETAVLTAELERTRTARDQMAQDLQIQQDRARTLETRLGDATSRASASQQDVQDLTARVAQLNARIADLSGTLDQATAALETEKASSDSERRSGQQLAAEAAALRQQLSQIESTLRDSEATVTARDLEIANLSSRLNQALVRRVDELSRSRSVFFGRLRDVLGDRPDVRVVGDRFVFQSEVLFPVGSAELQEGGKQQLAAFAATLQRIAAQFPPDVDWLLRIDGHTDRQPFLGAGQSASNWELSTARALSVLNFLASEGIPSARMAAAGFGEFQPLDPGSTPEAYRRNRRIELRLDPRGDNTADAGAAGQ